jgi:hypothetical protein
MDKKYAVKVDDNFHYMDESERYDGGSYSTLEEAIERCKEITIKSLKGCYEKGMDADKLIAQWSMFGDDPFIIGEGGKPAFSARAFVSRELCAEIIAEIERNKPKP